MSKGKEDFFLQWFLDSCNGCDHDLEDHEGRWPSPGACTATVSGCGPGDNMDVWEYDCDCAAFQVHPEIHWDNDDHERTPRPSDCPCCDECDAEAYAEEATW